MHRHIMISLLALSAATTGFAQETGQMSAGIGISSFGANLEAGFQINEQLRVRGALMGGISVDETEQEGNETIETAFDLGGAAVIADFYPARNGFRLSGGLVFTDFSFTTRLTGDVEIDNVTYPGETIEISGAFNREVAPLIGVGYDLPVGANWQLNSDIGAVLVDGISLTATSSNATALAALEDDADYQDLQEAGNDLSVYPYISIVLMRRF